MPLLDRCVYTCRHGVAKGLRRRGGLDFIARGLSKEEAFLLEQDFDGKTVYDVGAFRGILTIFFARAVGAKGRVIAFEPNPFSRKRAEENVLLNNFCNVQILGVGLGKEPSRAVQAFKLNNLAQATFQENAKEKTLSQSGSKSVEVQIETIDHLIADQGLPPPDFVKIDVEGLEDSVLLGMVETLQEHGPSLFIELHGPGTVRRQARAVRIVTLLVGLGYRVKNIEREIELTPENAAPNSFGHFYCTCSNDYPR